MDDGAKLAMLKTMVGIATSDKSEDVTLAVYLSLSANKILLRAFPYDDTQTTVPARYETLQCEIAAYLWNKRGAEGELSHNENSINRSYESADVPESLMSRITPKVGVI